MESERATSKNEGVRPSDDKAGAKKGFLEEADGIIHGDAKKAGKAVIQNDEKASS
jgi:hypothetical protein